MGNDIFRIRSWVSYIKHRRTNQYVHSPFLFELMNAVFDDSSKNSDPLFEKIESLRADLLKNNSTISFKDFGAGSQPDLTYKKVVIAGMAKRSLKQPKYGRFLFRLAKHLHAKTVVELGTCFGITTSYFATSGNNVNVVTVEGDKQVLDIAKTVWEKQHLNSIRSYSFDLNKNLSGLFSTLGAIDLLFIDANHRKEAMIRYYNQSKPFLHEKSVVVFDDINWSEDTAVAWNHIKADKDVTLSFDIFQMGCVFFDKRLSKENFTLKY